MNDTFVSIVVPTFRRRDSVRRLIAALGRQDYPTERFEVIVVDDGSGDDTVDMLRSLATSFAMRVIERSHGGPGAARNLGVAEATGDLILFLDDDVVPDSGLIAAHVAAHHDTDAVAIGPMLPPDGWRRPVWIRWEEDRLLRQYRAMTQGLWPCTYRQFYTANASIGRERFVAAGGFDVSFVRAEDVDLGFRLHQRDSKFAFVPTARVWHYPQRSFESWQKTPYRYGQADVVMWGKGNPALAISLYELGQRRWLSRVICRALVGRPALLGAATLSLGAVARSLASIGLGMLAQAALSGLFELQYWQGASEALEDPALLRHPSPPIRPQVAP